jgi:hypothetical protein
MRYIEGYPNENSGVYERATANQGENNMQDKDIERVGAEVADEITREPREFDYAEVSKEVDRLGLAYPKDEDFTEDDITEAIGNLSEYHLRTDVATYSGKKFSPAQMKAFATFVATIGDNAEISVDDYRGMKVLRDTSPIERREQALTNLKSAKREAHRQLANKRLQERYAAYEID